VLSRDDATDPALYEQPLAAGLNYVTMRDGIELAMTVRLPSGMTLEDGPFPTVIEYSGYQVAAPGDLFAAAVAAVSAGGGLASLSDPMLPATSTAVGSIIAPLLGYVAVSVQMRGSGCSGGDFQLFDVPTTFDAHDAIEVVAAQPWVKGGKVGLVGISFSGISQLFAGGTRPPHLAAITPLSVTDHIYSGTGFPGGIFNDGFAASWLNERQDNARPAPEEGAQPYALKRTRRNKG
jgi:putative CocE/NonD family hydrolase